MTANLSSVSRSLLTARVSLLNALVAVGVVGAGAYAAGQSLSRNDSSSLHSLRPASSSSVVASTEMDEVEDVPEAIAEGTERVPAGHPPLGGDSRSMAAGLPVGHPPIDSVARPGPTAFGASAPELAPLEWKAPGRWQPATNASTMRLATYRIPHTSGEAEDAEVAVLQAGGSVEANVERWVGQFDTIGQKTAKRSTRKVGPLDVTMVEVHGTYSGGMSKDASPRSGWAMLGAIVNTPQMPTFFKLTGPSRTVIAARAEFDAMIDSVVLR